MSPSTPAPATPRRIAIVGSGIAGLTCAHVLSPEHEVVLFEADDRLGGHSNTVDVVDPEVGPLAIDTGFIVHNERNYPGLIRLFDELDVATSPTTMSFGVVDRARRLEYRATSPRTIFANRRNLADPAIWRMLGDIPRFWRHARAVLAHPPTDGASPTLGEFVEGHRYSPAFVTMHLEPMLSAIWSSDPALVAGMPVATLFRFLDNHGLLGIGNRPQWRYVVGGSRTYVEALVDRADAKFHTAQPVDAVTRTADDVTIETADLRESFDAVILACHADQALRMLAAPTPDELAVLGAIRFQPNAATLHTDVSVLADSPRARAAWNVDLTASEGAPTVTYDLTELQHLGGSRRYLLSLNMDDRIDDTQVLARFDYAHPLLDVPAVEAQRLLADVNGADRVYFCGAWTGYGFHEDGLRSALDVCERLGVRW